MTAKEEAGSTIFGTFPSYTTWYVFRLSLHIWKYKTANSLSDKSCVLPLYFFCCSQFDRCTDYWPQCSCFVSNLWRLHYYKGELEPHSKVCEIRIDLELLTVVQSNIPDWWIWVHYANPGSYAFYGLAANELWGTSYTCKQSELQPPTSEWNFNLTYPVGFEGMHIVLPCSSKNAYETFYSNNETFVRQPSLSSNQWYRICHSRFRRVEWRTMDKMDNVCCCDWILVHLFVFDLPVPAFYQTRSSSTTADAGWSPRWGGGNANQRREPKCYARYQKK